MRFLFLLCFVDEEVWLWCVDWRRRARAAAASGMENYLNENFSDVKAKNTSEEALQRWRKLCGFVKNKKRRFRFTANLSKRFEAEAIRRSNQVSFLWIWHFSITIIIIFFKKSQNKNPTSNLINFTVLITFSCVSFRQQLLIDIQIQSVVLFPLPGTWSCWFTHVFRLLDCLCFKTPWGYSFCFHLNHANLMLSIYSFSLKG